MPYDARHLYQCEFIIMKKSIAVAVMTSALSLSSQVAFAAGWEFFPVVTPVMATVVL